jgi:GT2 family glycosyltransferase
MTIALPTASEPVVSLIIPATASLDFLLACLRSLQRFAPADLPFETIVVLNNATAEKQALLRSAASGILVAASADNLGFAGSANRGRSLARGTYLVLLHDDAEIEDGWLQALVQTARDHPEAGAVGSKVCDLDGRLQNAGMILWSDATTSPPWIGSPPSADAFDRLRAVDYCGSSSLLVRADAWDAVGGLDENFYPVYYVDVDLCLALRQRGYRVLYQPLARIRHHRSASTQPDFRTFVVRRNRARFLQKWQQALTQQEAPRAGSEQAISRAIARAEAAAASASPPDGTIAQKPAAFDGDAQELRLLRLRCAMQRDYIAELASRLAASAQPRAPRYLRALRRLMHRPRIDS